MNYGLALEEPPQTTPGAYNLSAFLQISALSEATAQPMTVHENVAHWVKKEIIQKIPFIYIVTGETRYAGCLCTSSGWFKHIEPRRTFPNHIITEIVRCVEFCHMSSGWFDCTEPSLSTSLQGKQGVQGAYALVRGGSSTSNLVEPSRTTSLQRWQSM